MHNGLAITSFLESEINSCFIQNEFPLAFKIPVMSAAKKGNRTCDVVALSTNDRFAIFSENSYLWDGFS